MRRKVFNFVAKWAAKYYELDNEPEPKRVGCLGGSAVMQTVGDAEHDFVIRAIAVGIFLGVIHFILFQRFPGKEVTDG